MEYSRTDVEFFTHDEVRLRGWLYLPRTGSPVPGIIMSHGFTATKEMGLAPFAEVFAAAGMAVLVYDHRALGESEGEPRFYVDAWVQSRDMLAAIAWLAASPAVDAGRIGLWGTSFSGGEVLMVGAIDPTVRAVVGVVPFAGEPGAPAVGTAEGFAALEARIVGATVETTMRDVRRIIPEDGCDDMGMMGTPESIAWFSALAQQTQGRWSNRVLLPAAPGEVAFNPAVAIPYLNGPALFIVATNDDFAATEEAKTAFTLAPEGSALLVIEGHHFTLYGDAPFAQAASASRDFFLRTL